MPEHDADAERFDPAHLRLEHRPRQPISRDAETHHAACERLGIANLGEVAEPSEMIDGGKPGGTG